MKESCANCRFRPEQECQKRAPQNIYLENVGYRAVWPYVPAGMWCGEHEGTEEFEKFKIVDKQQKKLENFEGYV